MENSQQIVGKESMNAKKEEKITFLTSTFEIRNKKYLALELFEVQEQF